jgi:nitrite reductase/ring-hydroxylating ferredoxin subunit
MPFVHAGTLNALPPGRSRRVLLSGCDITLWNAGGTIHAMNTACPHQHIPALHQGMLEGTKLTCPMHGWTFSLATGCAEGGSGRLTLHAVALRGGDVYVDLPDEF